MFESIKRLPPDISALAANRAALASLCAEKALRQVAPRIAAALASGLVSGFGLLALALAGDTFGRGVGGVAALGGAAAAWAAISALKKIAPFAELSEELAEDARAFDRTASESDGSSVPALPAQRSRATIEELVQEGRLARDRVKGTLVPPEDERSWAARAGSMAVAVAGSPVTGAILDVAGVAAKANPKVSAALWVAKAAGEWFASRRSR